MGQVETAISIQIYPEKNIWGYQIIINKMGRGDIKLVYTGFKTFEEVLIKVCERLLCYFLGKERGN